MRADRVRFFPWIDQPLDREIERIGAVKRKDKMLGFLPMKKPIEPPPAFADEPPRFDCLVIRPASCAGAHLGRVPIHRLVNAPRLWKTGSRIIQIQPPRWHAGMIGGN